MRKPKVKTVRTKKGKKMETSLDTPVMEPILTKKDMKDSAVLEIRAEQGSTGKLVIFIRNPPLADVVEKMAMGNYLATDFDKIYKPCLMPHPNPEAKGRVATRPAIYNATKNFEAAADFSFTSAPRGILIANPKALRDGYELVVELQQPVPIDTLRKWGKHFNDGCADIISASRPFKMSWVMTKSPLGTL